MALAITASSASIGELQRDYLFTMAVLREPSGALNTPAVKNMIDLYMTKGVFPSRKTAEIAVKWAGETVYYSGVDESVKTGDLVFRLDGGMTIKNYWESLKDLTGDLAAHAAALKANQTLTLAVYMVAPDKRTITDGRLLENVIVYSVEDINLDKEGSGIVTFKVHISWDRSSKNIVKADLGTPDAAAKPEDTLAYVTSNPPPTP
jgi:hypothetical protein